MSDSYSVKEVFVTLQGEGARAGSKSVFVRFAGCNLWSGHPDHRGHGKGPCAQWCDTDFFRGEALELDALCERMDAAWAASALPAQEPWCVLTGGEPALQLDGKLVDRLHGLGWKIAVETNGTVQSDVLRLCDHVCISPKRGTAWSLLPRCDEVKVILPGAMSSELGWTEHELLEIEGQAEAMRAALFVQPQDPLVDPALVEQTHLKRRDAISVDRSRELAERFQANVTQCIDWVMAHPRWRLSAQLHKYIGIS